MTPENDLPWPTIFGYLPLHSILACRATCINIAVECSNIPINQCVHMITRIMKRRRMSPAWHIMTTDSANYQSDWNDYTGRDIAMASIFKNWLSTNNKNGIDNSQCSNSSPFDTFLYVLRIMRATPMQVTFSTKSSTPNDTSTQSELSLLDHASGSKIVLNCPLCRNKRSDIASSTSKLNVVSLDYESVNVVTECSELSYTPLVRHQGHDGKCSSGTIKSISKFVIDRDQRESNQSILENTRKHIIVILCESCEEFAIQMPIHNCSCKCDHACRRKYGGRPNLTRKVCATFECNQAVFCDDCCNQNEKGVILDMSRNLCEECGACYCDSCSGDDENVVQMKFRCPCRLYDCLRRRTKNDKKRRKMNRGTHHKGFADDDYYFKCDSEQEDKLRKVSPYELESDRYVGSSDESWF